MASLNDEESWLKALRTFPGDKASEIEAIALTFECTGLGCYIIPRLKKEHFLKSEEMRKFQEFFLNAGKAPDDDDFNDYKNLCIAHVLHGDLIQTAKMPKKIGRAVEKEALTEWVFEASNNKIPRKQIGLSVVTQKKTTIFTSIPIS